MIPAHTASAFFGAAHFAADLVTLFLFHTREIFVEVTVQGDARGGAIHLFEMSPAALCGFRFERGEGGR